MSQHSSSPNPAFGSQPIFDPEAFLDKAQSRLESLSKIIDDRFEEGFDSHFAEIGGDPSDFLKDRVTQDEFEASDNSFDETAADLKEDAEISLEDHIEMFEIVAGPWRAEDFAPVSRKIGRLDKHLSPTPDEIERHDL